MIVILLLVRAATISELGRTLGIPKGTIGHHVGVLVETGLIHVVGTKKVRAIEAKYYGRTAPTHILTSRIDHGTRVSPNSPSFPPKGHISPTRRSRDSPSAPTTGWGMMPMGSLLGGAIVAFAEPLAGREWALRLPYVFAFVIQAGLFPYALPRLNSARIEAARATAKG